MRVTTSSYNESLVNHLQRITRRQVNLQEQISTGQRVTSPEDDPFAAGQVLRLREQSAAASQYQGSIENHREFAGATHDLMRSLKTVLDRAQEIAFAADGLDSTGDLSSFAAEVGQLIKRAVQVANTTHRGEYLLAGTLTATQPFTAELDSEGLVTSVTFAGNTEQRETEIAQGILISSRVAGENSSGSGERGLITDSRSGADLFAHLIALQQSLASGDAATVASTVRPLLQRDEENIINHLAQNASLQSRLDATLNSTKDEKLAVEGEISRHADADIAETIVRLNESQTSYQAALQSAGSVLNLTLLDFLR